MTGTDSGDAALQRTNLLAVVGLWSNILFLAIILAGGAALLVFEPCQR